MVKVQKVTELRAFTVFRRDSPIRVYFTCGTAVLSPTGVSPPALPAPGQPSFPCISKG
jgi:hypothetical protein